MFSISDGLFFKVCNTNIASQTFRSHCGSRGILSDPVELSIFVSAMPGNFVKRKRKSNPQEPGDGVSHTGDVYGVEALKEVAPNIVFASRIRTAFCRNEQEAS